MPLPLSLPNGHTWSWHLCTVGRLNWKLDLVNIDSNDDDITQSGRPIQRNIHGWHFKIKPEKRCDRRRTGESHWLHQVRFGLSSSCCCCWVVHQVQAHLWSSLQPLHLQVPFHPQLKALWPRTHTEREEEKGGANGGETHIGGVKTLGRQIYRECKGEEALRRSWSRWKTGWRQWIQVTHRQEEGFLPLCLFSRKLLCMYHCTKVYWRAGCGTGENTRRPEFSGKTLVRCSLHAQDGDDEKLDFFSFS